MREKREKRERKERENREKRERKKNLYPWRWNKNFKEKLGQEQGRGAQNRVCCPYGNLPSLWGRRCSPEGNHSTFLCFNPNDFVVELDIVNAFNSISRESIFTGAAPISRHSIQKEHPCSPLLPFFILQWNVVYSKINSLFGLKTKRRTSKGSTNLVFGTTFLSSLWMTSLLLLPLKSKTQTPLQKLLKKIKRCFQMGTSCLYNTGEIGLLLSNGTRELTSHLGS